MRAFKIYNNGTSTKIEATRPLMGEGKDREINTKLSIIDLVVKLSDRNHIFDVVFWLDGEEYGVGQIKKLEEAMESDNSLSQPTARFLSSKDSLTLSRFAEMV